MHSPSDLGPMHAAILALERQRKEGISALQSANLEELRANFALNDFNISTENATAVKQLATRLWNEAVKCNELVQALTDHERDVSLIPLILWMRHTSSKFMHLAIVSAAPGATFAEGGSLLNAELREWARLALVFFSRTGKEYAANGEGATAESCFETADEYIEPLAAYAARLPQDQIPEDGGIVRDIFRSLCWRAANFWDLARDIEAFALLQRASTLLTRLVPSDGEFAAGMCFNFGIAARKQYLEDNPEQTEAAASLSAKWLELAQHMMESSTNSDNDEFDNDTQMQNAENPGDDDRRDELLARILRMLARDYISLGQYHDALRTIDQAEAIKANDSAAILRCRLHCHRAAQLQHGIGGSDDYDQSIKTAHDALVKVICASSDQKQAQQAIEACHMVAEFGPTNGDGLRMALRGLDLFGRQHTSDEDDNPISATVRLAMIAIARIRVLLTAKKRAQQTKEQQNEEISDQTILEATDEMIQITSLTVKSLFEHEAEAFTGAIQKLCIEAHSLLWQQAEANFIAENYDSTLQWLSRVSGLLEFLGKFRDSATSFFPNLLELQSRTFVISARCHLFLGMTSLAHTALQQAEHVDQQACNKSLPGTALVKFLVAVRRENVAEARKALEFLANDTTIDKATGESMLRVCAAEALEEARCNDIQRQHDMTTLAITAMQATIKQWDFDEIDIDGSIQGGAEAFGKMWHELILLRLKTSLSPNSVAQGCSATLAVQSVLATIAMGFERLGIDIFGFSDEADVALDSIEENTRAFLFSTCWNLHAIAICHAEGTTDATEQEQTAASALMMNFSRSSCMCGTAGTSDRMVACAAAAILAAKIFQNSLQRTSKNVPPFEAQARRIDIFAAAATVSAAAALALATGEPRLQELPTASVMLRVSHSLWEKVRASNTQREAAEAIAISTMLAVADVQMRILSDISDLASPDPKHVLQRKPKLSISSEVSITLKQIEDIGREGDRLPYVHDLAKFLNRARERMLASESIASLSTELTKATEMTVLAAVRLSVENCLSLHTQQRSSEATCESLVHVAEAMLVCFEACAHFKTIFDGIRHVQRCAQVVIDCATAMARSTDTPSFWQHLTESLAAIAARAHNIGILSYKNAQAGVNKKARIQRAADWLDAALDIMKILQHDALAEFGDEWEHLSSALQTSCERVRQALDSL